MEEKKKNTKNTARRLNTLLTGVLFAAYSAYNVFILFRDFDDLTTEAKFICVVVAVMFALFAVFVWIAGVKERDGLFLFIRRVIFIIALLTIFGLRLRLTERVIAYLDLNDTETILYGCAYFATQAALLCLAVYYLFILIARPLYPKASVILPIAAMVLFLGSLVIEAILFFRYHHGMEASPLRTLVMRPVFYFGLIGLSLYFLFPPQSSDVGGATEIDTGDKTPEEISDEIKDLW